MLWSFTLYAVLILTNSVVSKIFHVGIISIFNLSKWFFLEYGAITLKLKIHLSLKLNCSVINSLYFKEVHCTLMLTVVSAPPSPEDFQFQRNTQKPTLIIN